MLLLSLLLHRGTEAVSCVIHKRSLVALYWFSGKTMQTLPFEALSVSSPPLKDQAFATSVVGRARSQWFSAGRVTPDRAKMFFGACFIRGTRWELGEVGR